MSEQRIVSEYEWQMLQRLRGVALNVALRSHVEGCPRFRIRPTETHPCQACGKGIAHPAGKGRKPKFCDSRCRYAVHKDDVKADRESTRSKPCKRPGCHGMTAHGAKFCSPECARQHHAAPVRLCPECGKVNTRPKAWLTCSVECARARRTKTDATMRRETSKPCEVCGAAISAPPSTLATRRTCGSECLSKLRAARPAPEPTPCVVCGAPCVKRKTCGPACRSKLMLVGSTVGARSESKRARRRREAKNAYRGKDKGEVVRRLTQEQKGRCKVCGDEGTELGHGERGLVLDHCHATGRPRAMLCTRCNAALGMLKESPSRIKALSDYAQSWAQAVLV